MDSSLDLDNFQAKAETWKYVQSDAFNTLFFFKAIALWKFPEIISFLFSDPDLDDDKDWRPVRPLGQGGFGAVGLWQKFDRNGNVKDSIAIKQQRHPRNEQAKAGMMLGDKGLAKEAEIMRQLNDEGVPNIIKLRGFRNHKREKLWRFYLEFAPWGDLRLLKNKYSAWNTHFPEEFLFHVFHGLAHAAVVLKAGNFFDYNDRDAQYEEGQAFVVHFDLKPENVFLADPIVRADYPYFNYPAVKMGDFGLAVITGRFDEWNPRMYRSHGTPGYIPPVRCSHPSLLDQILTMA